MPACSPPPTGDLACCPLPAALLRPTPRTLTTWGTHRCRPSPPLPCCPPSVLLGMSGTQTPAHGSRSPLDLSDLLLDLGSPRCGVRVPCLPRSPGSISALSRPICPVSSSCFERDFLPGKPALWPWGSELTQRASLCFVKGSDLVRFPLLGR